MCYIDPYTAYSDGYNEGYEEGYSKGRNFGQNIGIEDGEYYAWEIAIRLLKLPNYCLDKYFSNLKDKDHDCIFTYRIFESYTAEQLEEKLNEIEKKEKSRSDKK